MNPANGHDVGSTPSDAAAPPSALDFPAPPLESAVPPSPLHDPQPVLDLLDRMRDGDRDAAAIFVRDYGSRIRRRVRGKLTPSMRRLFDSQEIMSTVGRRLDLFVRSGRLTAATEAQLWALVFRAAENALVDRQRAFARLKATEGEDGPVARAILSRMRTAGTLDDAADVELHKVFAALENPIDRTILALWFSDTPHHVVVDLTGLSSEAVYKRWTRIKARLRKFLETEEC